MKLPDNPSDAVRRRNLHLFAKQASAPEQLKQACSTDEAKLNKTEREFFVQLRRLHPGCRIGVQDLTFKLAHDCRYTPDFTLWDDDGRLTVWEVKGFWRDDAKVKIKVAARLFPHVRFIVVRKAAHSWGAEGVKA